MLEVAPGLGSNLGVLLLARAIPPARIAKWSPQFSALT